MKLISLIIFLPLALIGWKSQAQIVINEVMSANATTIYDPHFYNFPDWVELYNTGAEAQSLAGLYLTDDPSNLKKWPLPGLTLNASDYLVIYCDKEDHSTHANFSLSANGETLVLSNGNGEPLDVLAFPELPVDISYGRVIGDSTVIGYFTSPTPDDPNVGGISERDVSAAPEFSIEGMRIDSPVPLELTGSEIKYTLDGSEPTWRSRVYSDAIVINQTMTVKAKSFEEGKLPSETVANTYFYNEHTFSLPVVSLSFDPDFFYDDKIGIHVRGTNGSEGYCGSIRNWNQDWERAAFFEYFDEEGEKQISQLIGVKIGGGCTRGRDQKSLSLYARDKYGDGDFDYAFFNQKPIDRYESLFLRNSGNDQDQTLIRDAAVQAMVVNAMDLDYQCYQPTVVYFNGEYRGIMNLREKVDEDYFDSNYDLQDDEIDFLEGEGEVARGSSSAYYQFLEFISTNDLNTESNYQQLATDMDIQEFINYFATEIYIGNRDWPQRNIKYWRKQDGGKWRWVLYDTDYGFGFRMDEPNHETFHKMFDATSDEAWSTELFRNLMESESFKKQFLATFYANMYSSFHPDWCEMIIDSLASGINVEIGYNQSKYGRSKNDWTYWVNFFKGQTTDRFAFMEEYVREYFNLTGPVTVKIDNQQPNQGDVYVNEVKLQMTLFEMNTFSEIPLKVVAKPRNSAIPFLHWKYADGSGVYSAEAEISLNETVDLDLIPVFGAEGPLSSSGSNRNLKVYPNPATQSFQVDIESERASLSIRDLSGKVILEQVIKRGERVSLPGNISNGTYIIGVQAGTEISTHKLVVKKP